MAYEPLHHKYRPQTFAELVGQEAVATTLTNALKQQKIAPAYLFTGARGTGKTSSARILAKSLNCLQSNVPTEKPCGVCEVCCSIANGSALDVIEIDAASNTGVDNIRELIERSQFAPVQCRYKVYVIDECHMLSTAAFNALLKTLEEPPDRVVFVLATTDPQRVLPTIISRCQRFDFRRIELGAMVQHLARIANQEAIEIVPEAIQLVAQIAQGGLRDAESMLDQLSLLEGQISVERVWDLVGAVPERDLLALVEAITQNQPTAVIDRVRHLMDRGREPLIVLQNLASFYRDLLIAKTTPTRSDLVAITASTWAEICRLVETLDLQAILKGQQHLRTSELQIKNTTQPRLWLEVTLLGLLPDSQEAESKSQTAGNRHTVPSREARIEGAVSQRSPVRPVVAPSVVPAITPTQPEPTPATMVSRPEPAALPEPVSLPEPRANPVAARTVAPEAPETPETPDVAAESVVPQPQVNLEQVWRSIIEVLQPPGTQALFKQQGRLLALETQSARVGISSQPLFKMAQMRIANLEAAFTQLVQSPVKVSLEVLNTNDASASAESPSIPATASTIPSPPTFSTPAKPIPQESVKNGNGSVAEAAPPYATGKPYANRESASQPIAPTAEPAPLSQAWQEEDEVHRAAKSLAQMFNGQIVSWAEDLPVTAIREGLEQTAVDLEVEDGDPDGDVPF